MDAGERPRVTDILTVPPRYAHTNLVARDWRRLADFYVDVFGCEPVPPERDLEGAWLDHATGLRSAHVRGVHLRLPGHGAHGPTLEVFGYDESLPQPEPAANRFGFGHIAFEVDDVAATLDRLVEAGGGRLGEIARTDIPGAGRLELVYALDPEGNVLELQAWG
jgi:catechol 2,3-dioxygenase-like lactoylglutathione lyase family enzyme